MLPAPGCAMRYRRENVLKRPLVASRARQGEERKLVSDSAWPQGGPTGKTDIAWSRPALGVGGWPFRHAASNWTAIDIKGKPMKKYLVASLFAAAVLAALPARAEDKIADVTDMQALRAAVRTDKKAFVESTLKLTPAEAKKFWPLYDAYQRVLDTTGRQRAVIVESLVSMDKPLSDLYAKNLANGLIAADEAELKGRRKLHNAVMKALPDKKAARYLQLESKIRAVQAYDIAQTIPLVK
jgi:hypothetical protein